MASLAVQPRLASRYSLHVVAEPGAQHVTGLDVQGQRAAPDLQFEGGDAEVLAKAQRFVKQFLGRTEAEHVRDAHRIGVAAQQLVHRGAKRLAQQVPQRDVDGAFGHLVVDGPVHHLVHLAAIEGIESHHLRGEDLFDDGDDRVLRFAVGVGARRSVGLPDQPLVRVDAHQHVLGIGDLPAGELERVGIGNRIGDRFDALDLHA